MNGLAPSPSNTLGRPLDPEGFVVLPKSGNFLVCDEYGPAVREFDRSGNLLRTFATPANVAGCVAPVPEPETWALMLAGLGFIGSVARRRRS